MDQNGADNCNTKADQFKIEQLRDDLDYVNDSQIDASVGDPVKAFEGVFDDLVSIKNPKERLCIAQKLNAHQKDWELPKITITTDTGPDGKYMKNVKLEGWRELDGGLFPKLPHHANADLSFSADGKPTHGRAYYTYGGFYNYETWDYNSQGKKTNVHPEDGMSE